MGLASVNSELNCSSAVAAELQARPAASRARDRRDGLGWLMAVLLGCVGAKDRLLMIFAIDCRQGATIGPKSAQLSRFELDHGYFGRAGKRAAFLPQRLLDGC